MSRHPHPIVEVILDALAQQGANVQITRVATDRLDVSLTLTALDGRRVVVNIAEDGERR